MAKKIVILVDKDGCWIQYNDIKKVIVAELIIKSPSVEKSKILTEIRVNKK
jgi:hypothetical protein